MGIGLLRTRTTRAARRNGQHGADQGIMVLHVHVSIRAVNGSPRLVLSAMNVTFVHCVFKVKNQSRHHAASAVQVSYEGAKIHLPGSGHGH
jgi:hypothetical protein